MWTRTLAMVVVFGKADDLSTCPYQHCRDDSDCTSSACSWCSSPTPGKNNNQTCTGPPSPDDCGVLPEPNKTTKLQYADWGDSVSKGIFAELAHLLTRYEPFHPSNNVGGGCGNVIRGKFCTDLWLHGADGVANQRKWDVITFNFGLHDMAQDSEHVDLNVYKRNLKNISSKLLAAADRVFWVSSTPVPNIALSPPRPQKDVAIYNKAAKEVMDELHIPIIDLYAFVIEHCGGDEHYTTCPGFQQLTNVHFEKAGYQKMARYIHRSIRTYNTTVLV